MKKIILTIPLLIALAMFCNGQNVKGKIGFSFKPQNDSVTIAVVCHDSKERIEKVIQDQNLKYINAMATDEIIGDFGISKYPTTYLVDPNGIIVGKDLRGDNLASRIGNILKN